MKKFELGIPRDNGFSEQGVAGDSDTYVLVVDQRMYGGMGAISTMGWP